MARRILKSLIVVFPVLALIAGISLITAVGNAGISEEQFQSGFAYYAGLHPAFQNSPFIVILQGTDTVAPVHECVHFPCPMQKMEEITRKWFGDDFAQVERRDALGLLAGDDGQQAVEWQKEMCEEEFRHLPAMYINEYPVYVGFDPRGQPTVMILIWATIVCLIGSAIIIPCAFFLMRAESRRASADSEELG